MSKGLFAVLYKPLRFGLWGGIGCLLGAVVGEILLTATRQPPPPAPPPPPPLSLCLLIDCSSSMEQGTSSARGATRTKLDEVKSAAGDFVRRQDLSACKIAVVPFASGARVVCPLTAERTAIEHGIGQLKADGGTQMGLGLRVALDALRSAPGDRSILLFTDGMPNDRNTTWLEAESVKTQKVQLVAIGTEDAKVDYLSQLTGSPALVFEARSGNYGSAFERAERELPKYVAKQLGESASLVAQEYGDSTSLLRWGGWTGSLAIGLSLALIMSQASYLHQRLLTVEGAVKGVVGGGAAGFLAGAVGQWLFQVNLLGVAHTVALGTLSRVVAWTSLGGLLGTGMAAFVPNLRSWKGLLGGGLGGAAGAAIFLAVANGLGDVPGRFAGAFGLGLFIGLMVALAEVAFRKVWLEICYGPQEFRTVTLGAEPVTIGSDHRACTIYARNTAPQAFRYRVQNGAVLCEDVCRGQTTGVSPGERKAIGSLYVTVCSSADTGFLLCLPKNKVVQLQEGSTLTEADVPGLRGASADGVVADISRNPADASIVGLRNRSLQTWIATLPDGATRSVETGKTVRLAHGTKLDLGGVAGEVTRANPAF